MGTLKTIQIVWVSIQILDFQVPHWCNRRLKRSNNWGIGFKNSSLQIETTLLQTVVKIQILVVEWIRAVALAGEWRVVAVVVMLIITGWWARVIIVLNRLDYLEIVVAIRMRRVIVALVELKAEIWNLVSSSRCP